MRSFILALIGAALLACAGPRSPDTHAPPPGAMVSAANPYAVDAAVQILAAGGHAVDAAIAAHAVLGLVEPQSSGLGGGAFMVVYDTGCACTSVYDARETAPATTDENLFVVDDRTLPFLEAWQSGRSVGVPGVPALYDRVHARHGRLPIGEVMAPAIALARDGFVVSPRLAGFLERIRTVSRLDDNAASAAYFYPGGQPLRAGEVRVNPAYAHTLSLLASKGSRSFYSGTLADEIVTAVAQPPYPGGMTVTDLAGYAVIERDALCADARSLRLCTAPPPSSGVAVLMILNLYDRLIGDADDETSRLTAFVDAQRLAYADRDHYIADVDALRFPVADLLVPAYLDARAGQRLPPGATPTPGDPGRVLRGEPVSSRFGVDSTVTAPGTTHLSIVDADGNAVAMTASIEAPFGSSRWAGGFLLNNELTDFARESPATDPAPANAPAAGKRPRSSMSPVIVFDANGQIRMITGSPGGNSIIAYVAKSLIGVLRWGLDAQASVDLPNIVARGRTVRVETREPTGQRWAALLAGEGYDVLEREGENSGLHTIVIDAGRLDGGADPRREGRVRTWPKPDRSP